MDVKNLYYPNGSNDSFVHEYSVGEEAKTGPKEFFRVANRLNLIVPIDKV